MEPLSPCPNCGSRTLYAGPAMVSGAGHGPDLLAGLRGFFRRARFVTVVCRDCGLMRLFASAEDRQRLSESSQWKTVTPSDRGGFR
jgi:predicted nucleic-acid-binding Zn-ribbon protein